MSLEAPLEKNAVRIAADRIAPAVVRTPVVRSLELSARIAGDVFLKLENLQVTGSFKSRGALNALLAHGVKDFSNGVITMSAGNHAQAVAYHARRLGIPATIVMPETTPLLKIRRTRELGAHVILHGDNLADCVDLVNTLVSEEHLQLIHPYDDLDVVCGQATATYELLEDVGALDVLLVPVGGGGLIAGAVLAAGERGENLEILGIESTHYAAFRAAMTGSESITGMATIADGIAVKQPGKLPLAIAKRGVKEILLVTEPAIETAIEYLLEQERLVAEGAGAVGVAALLSNEERFRGKRVGIIISGGNIDPGLLASVIARSRIRSGTVARIRVHIIDRPGQLGAIATAVASVGANVLDVAHHRLMGEVPVRYAELDLTVEVEDASGAQAILAALAERGFRAEILL